MEPIHPRREEVEETLSLVVEAARDYLERLDSLPARAEDAEAVAARFRTPLPEHGLGAEPVLRRLIDGVAAAPATSGPRNYHFVIGGSTPAAFGADWLATAWDQIAYAWVTSPLACTLELVSLGWLRELFGLPSSWGGIMVTGATMANFVGLAAARQWWGERYGLDVSQQGLSGAPPVPVLSSGHIHGSAVKCLAMLGIGRGNLRKLTVDAVGNLDLAALESALGALGGAPAIVVATVGEPNAGASDPVARVADLTERYGAWLHVDGAFGLFARLSPRTAHLCEGVERAQSVGVDGHKWLNVPYDCGLAFAADPLLLAKAFRYSGEYLPDPEDPKPNFGTIGPESSRRARGFAVWATLLAYGRDGHRAMVERHLDLAQRLARRIDESADLERLAEVPLSVVVFRYNPGGLDEASLDALNTRLGESLIADGRFYAGTTTYAGKVALRPAIVNWRTREEDVDGFVAVVRELGQAVAAGATAGVP